MHKLEDIPQDVWDAAELEVRRWPLDTDCVAELARAILTERERCAKVAEEWAFDEFELAQATQVGRGVDRASRQIAAAIRGEST